MEILEDEIYGNTLEVWLFALFVILVGIIVGWLISEIMDFSIRKITSKTRSTLDDELLTKAKKPVLFILFLLSVRYAITHLYFNAIIEEKVTRVLFFLFIMVFTWFFARVSDAIILEIFDKNRKNEDRQHWDAFSPVLKKGLRFGIWTLGFITALNNAGFDVGALLAGLGIGGLALALASQDTVKNVIGGLIIVFDKPFRLGDRIIVESHDGFVEDIGLRSTRLRNLEGRVISIPNALLSDKPIVNISMEPERKVLTTLQLSHENDNDKMALVHRLIREVLKNNVKVNEENFDVFTSGFGPFGIEVTVIYFIKLGNLFTLVQDEVNMKIRQSFYSNGIVLAVTDFR